MLETVTIIPNPSWGKVLQLFQEKGTIRISSSDNEKFKKLLDSISLKYKIEENLETKLTRFTLV